MNDMQTLIVSPAKTPTGGGFFGQRPFSYPGYPDDRRLTAQEALWVGDVYGVDTPRYVTPSGWGELIDVLYDFASVQDLLVYDEATENAEAQPRE